MTEADLAPWVTPAVVVALIAWLRLDVGRLINRVEANLSQCIDDMGSRMDRMEQRMDRMEQRMQGLDDRLRAVEVSVGTVYGRLDIIERYIMHRGEPTIEPPRVAAE
ncbi:MAG: hypothetical protein OXE76_10440 [Alphaproteobacteria bacterium]|nr:hypothetical protein [Alphaproteobacteria bacterium]